MDFCQSFVGNQNSIDFGYQPQEHDYYYLLIGKNYWQLSVNESSMTVQLMSDESRQNNWFGNQYRIAIRSEFHNENNDTILLAGLIHVLEQLSIDKFLDYFPRLLFNHILKLFFKMILK
jgi:hypothetical protein